MSVLLVASTCFYVVISLILVIFVKLTADYMRYWKKRNVPYLEPEFYYGNSRGMGSKYHAYEFMLKCYHGLKHLGPIGGAYIMTRPCAFVNDLDLVRTVLIKDFNKFANRGIFSNRKHDPISDHISNVEDEVWKTMRTNLTAAFSIGKLKLMVDAISGYADKLMDKFEKEMEGKESIDIKNILPRFTCDVMGFVAFGIECNILDEEDSDFFKIALRSRDSFDYVQRLVLMGYRRIARFMGMRLTPKEVSAFYMSIVKQILKYREDGTERKRLDLMNLLIDLNVGNKIPIEQIASNSFFYFVAGYENSSTTLTFCLFELAMNTEIQDKARHEVMTVLENHNNELTYDAIQDMTYMEKIFKETLRKWPPSISVQREATEDYHVPNTDIVIDKHTPVIVPVYAIHHDPEIYFNPETFDPSRFDKEIADKRHPYAFLSFGDGPRACPGNKLSMMKMKIALAKILLRFNVGLDQSKTSVPLVITPDKFIISPKDGVFINFSNRI